MQKGESPPVDCVFRTLVEMGSPLANSSVSITVSGSLYVKSVSSLMALL